MAEANTAAPTDTAPSSDSVPPASGVFHLACPDWRDIEHPLRIADPFALWIVGDQPLLYHWFDYALDRRYRQVTIYTSDRADRIRAAVNRATLWPLEFQVVTVTKMPNDMDAVTTGLPGAAETQKPSGPWELVAHWRALDNTWLTGEMSEALGKNLSIGRYCSIHPSAKLNPPFLIGDQVAIGPNAEIGPFAVIGSSSIVSENTIVRQARLMPHSFLGPQLTFEDSILHGGVIFNSRNRARIDRIEAFIADSIEAKRSGPTLGERLAALAWWLQLQLKLRCTAQSSSGRAVGDWFLPGIAQLPDWKRRIPLLWSAATGRLRLYGPLPRTEDNLASLPAEWQAILRDTHAGAIAYSDCLGCHSTDDPDEALHAVYQATHPEETTRHCRAFLHGIIHPDSV